MTRHTVRHATARPLPCGGILAPPLLLIPALGLLTWAIWLAVTLPPALTALAPVT